MKIRTKLILGFLFVAIIASIIGLVGYRGISQIMKSSDEISVVRLPSIHGLFEISNGQKSVWIGERGLINRRMMDKEIRKAQYDYIELAFKNADEGWKIYEPLPQTAEEAVEWKLFVPLWEQWKKDHQKVVDLSREKDKLMSNGIEKDDDKITKLDNDAFEASLNARQSFLKAEEKINALIDINIKVAKEEEAIADEAYSSAALLLIIFIIIGVIIAMALGLIIAANIGGILKQLVEETKKLVEAAVAGKLDTRADVNKTNFEFQEIPKGINACLDAVVRPLNVAAEYVDRISKGDVPPKITDSYNGDFNEIKNNLNKCIDAVNLLVTDAAMLSKSAIEGKLDTRADANKHDGDFKKIVQGVNDTLDNVIRPLNVAAEYVDRISNGDIPPRITDSYNGDFNEIKNNLNKCIDAVNMLVADANALSIAAVEGKLYTRANADKHQGDFKKIVEGVNDTINSLVGLLDNMPAPSMIVNNDYEVLFMNKAGAGLNNTTGENLFKSKTKCWDHFKTGDCKTQNCACNQAMQTGRDASSETIAKPGIHNLDIQYNGVPLKNKEGKIIGAFEVVMDQTAVKTAMRKNNKIGLYQETEAGKLKQALTQFSQGDMDINIKTEAADQDTIESQKMFGDIYIAVDETRNALIDITDKAKQVASGDLTVQLKLRSDKDELIQSLSEMVKSVADVVGQVQEAADNIASASEQMSANAQQVSQGATEQASAAEEVSSSMEQMSSNIQQNTENSQQTEKISINAAEGMEKVNKSALESLKSIKEIANKISIIGDIAFQTNILALNAAVEAARAGEHGKGFAVVAAEVRKLAERSKVAAEEIDVLSKTSVEVTEEAGKLMQIIIPDVEKTSKLVQEITAASIEQNSGANQINNAINQLNQVTQQNAAAAEEMATSTEELSSQADQLKEMVGFFRLDNSSDTKKKSSHTSVVKQKSQVKTVQKSHTQLSHMPIHSKGIHLNLHASDTKDSDFEKF